MQMMCQEAYFNIGYVNEVQTQVLELPYVGKELSMIILLPDDGVLLSSVSQEGLQSFALRISEAKMWLCCLLFFMKAPPPFPTFVLALQMSDAYKLSLQSTV